MTRTPARRSQRRLYDDRRAKDEPWRAWYRTSQWQGIRRRQLAASPLCEMCKAKDRIVPATVCHHAEPHRGDPERFWGGPFQSLCAPCHDGPVQAREKSGVTKGVTADGRPRDVNHPWNRPKA